MKVKFIFNWKTQTSQYTNGEYLYLGKKLVAEYNYSRIKEGDKNYRGYLLLPGDKFVVYFDEVEDGKQQIEDAVIDWFSDAFRDNIIK